MSFLLPNDDHFMKKLIEANNISKAFGEVHAVQKLSVDLHAGEIYGLVGPDGAGKTTTIRLLCGVLKPTDGTVVIAGKNIIQEPEQARAKIGYLAQRFSLYDDLTVMENIRFFAEVRGLSSSTWRTRCTDILTFVGLIEFTNRLAGHLSGGMKQKLSLAAALVHNPQILLLDEPTTGVDPVTRQDFWQLIIRLTAEEQIGVLVSTPYMDEAARCHRVGFMREGRLLTEGTPSALRKKLTEQILELAGEPLASLRRLAISDYDVDDVQAFGNRLHLRIRKGSAQLVKKRLKERAASEGFHILHIQLIPPQLEDVFISLSEE